MAKPLNLPIHPGTTGQNVSFSDWAVASQYGPVEPQTAGGPVFNNYALLSTAGDGRIYAAAAGTLSIWPPNMAKRPPTEPILETSLGSPFPRYLTLYAHLSPFVAPQLSLSARNTDIGGLVGFYYRYVDPMSLLVLGEALDRAVLTQKAKRATLTGFTRAQKLELLIRGEVEVRVTAGQEIGQATTSLSTTGRLFGFTALNAQGPIDPSLIYDYLREFVQDGQPVVDAFLGLLPKRWPVVGPDLSDNAVLLLTQFFLYPQNVLRIIMNRPGVKSSRSRELGDNQKKLWRSRLLKRTGHAEAASTAPPFEFDDVDLMNLFQLEALVEYYANLQDPWRTAEQVMGQNIPRSPTMADGTTANPDYVHVNFLNLRGAAASVAGNVVTLDGMPDLARVVVNHDTLELASADAAAAGRVNPLFRILALNQQAHTVTVHEEPTLTESTSAWEIHLRPVIVIVDSFGARGDLQGDAATGANNQVTLDGTQSLTHVNRYFDTIYLPDDTARASRTYRIQKIEGRVLTLDDVPSFGGGSSAWHIPAGVSGRLPNYDYNLGPNNAAHPGYDHYEGALFIVQDERVHTPIHFSSYTSRNGIGENLSSIPGNRKYRFSSLRSPLLPKKATETASDFAKRRASSSFRNYCFKVTDLNLGDQILNCRFYFREHVAPDPDKTAIRIHAGTRTSPMGGTGSAGCIVSPSFSDFRDVIVDLYQQEYLRVHGQPDSEVDKLVGRDLRRSQTLWTNTEDGTGAAADRLAEADWLGKIQGVLWLVRPDERPEG